MDEIRKIIVEAGEILKDRYYDSFQIHEKEKGHLAADVDIEAELYLKEQLYKIDSSIGFYGEETSVSESGLASGLSATRPCNPEGRVALEPVCCGKKWLNQECLIQS